MAQQARNIHLKRGAWPYVWLAIGAALWTLYLPGTALPVAAWLAPVFLLRFSRQQRPAVGLPILAVCFAAIEILTNGGMVAVWGRGLNYYLMCLIGGVPWVLPFLADRLLAPRLKSFLSTLAFPAAYAAYEYVNALAGPAGSWASLAYTQHSLPLLQVVSVTGLWGLTFLLTWFASVVNWAWEKGVAFPKVRRGLGIYAGVLVVVLLAGGARTAFLPPRADTVRVASIATSPALNDYPYPSPGGNWEPFRRKSAQAQKEILQLSQQAASTGARIVFWREAAILILKEDEAAFVPVCAKMAKEKGIYLGVTLGTLSRDFPRQYGQNKVIWIDPQGQTIAEYQKTKLVPGEPFLPGDGVLAWFDTPYGRIASPICYDMDFPIFIQQAGRAQVDLVLDPAGDWKGITPMHSHMAALRAIEQGFSLVKSTIFGLSAAYDYQGRTLSAADFFHSADPIMISDVPTEGVVTLYTRVGDAFAWACTAALIGLVALSIADGKRGEKEG